MDLPVASTAVLTMELQRGVCGDLAPMPHLTLAVEGAEMIANTARLLAAARAAGTTVVHCLFTIRPDGAGTNFDFPLMTAARQHDHLLRQGDPSAEVIAEIGPEPGDLIAERHHGLAPFTGTDLHSRLQALGVETLVVTGVSLNLGVIGLVVEAVGLGYRVVVARDAVVGIPVDHGEAVLRHAIGYVAEVVDVDDVVAAFNPG